MKLSSNSIWWSVLLWAMLALIGGFLIWSLWSAYTDFRWTGEKIFYAVAMVICLPFWISFEMGRWPHPDWRKKR